MARSLGHVMSTLVVQERHLWLCLVDIGMLIKLDSSRFLYPRLASLATGNMAQQFPAAQEQTEEIQHVLPWRLQHPVSLSPRATPCVHPRSRTASAAAFKSGAVELGIGRLPQPSWPLSTGGKRRSQRPRDRRPRERGNCFGRG